MAGWEGGAAGSSSKWHPCPVACAVLASWLPSRASPTSSSRGLGFAVQSPSMLDGSLQRPWPTLSLQLPLQLGFFPFPSKQKKSWVSSPPPAARPPARPRPQPQVPNPNGSQPGARSIGCLASRQAALPPRGSSAGWARMRTSTMTPTTPPSPRSSTPASTPTRSTPSSDSSPSSRRESTSPTSSRRQFTLLSSCSSCCCSHYSIQFTPSLPFPSLLVV